MQSCMLNIHRFKRFAVFFFVKNIKKSIKPLFLHQIDVYDYCEFNNDKYSEIHN